ncbi:hypothetical protein BsWGS_24074 [Bradybaena similaris]
MAVQEQKKSTEPTFVPGVVYIPDLIEVAEQPDLLLKIESDFSDFLICVRELLEMMHMLKVKHLRSMVPLPLNVFREMRLLQGKGPLFKQFDKQSGGNIPGISASVDTMFKRGMSSATVTTTRVKPALKKLETVRKRPLEADLIEVVGKKSKPLWHTVALEPPVDPLLSREEGEEEPPCAPDRILSKKDLPLSRTRSEEIIASIKYLSYTKVHTTDKKYQMQMDMLAASNEGFKSVESYKAFLDTLKPHWFKDLVRDAAKVGIISSINVIEAIEKLGRYYDMTSTSLPLAKPKLCFLVMSLPLWDIARMSMQMAVNFILHSILKAPKTHTYLREWLTARKLPYVVLPPVYAELVGLTSEAVKTEDPSASEATAK